MSGNGLTQKLWNYCNVLRDDGMNYGDHSGQPTVTPVPAWEV